MTYRVVAAAAAIVGVTCFNLENIWPDVTVCVDVDVSVIHILTWS